MRIVDFREMCSLPENTLFCKLDHVTVLHATHMGTLYVKMPPGSHPKLSFYGHRLDGWRSQEYSQDEIANAYMTGESLSYTTSHGPEEFLFKNNMGSRFAVWEKQEVEELIYQLQKVAQAFKPPANVSN
jgi:predicted DNA-binding transcriptional regulator AlpA